MDMESGSNGRPPSWTAVGAGIGAALGAATHDVAECLALCMAAGALADALFAPQSRACVLARTSRATNDERRPSR